MIVFLLAAMSIWCLLAQMYGLCSMRRFTLFILVPATVVLYGLAIADRQRGEGLLWRGVVIGTVAGLIAAAAYDVFRLPLVYARPWGIDGEVPAMPLYKVFPRFGAMILGQPVEQDHYSMSAQILGWLYHFSNGATFGVMYVALVGEAARRHWLWAVAMAVGIETVMLLSPYAAFFSIPLTATFVAVTLAAHTIFGVTMGLGARWFAQQWMLTYRWKNDSVPC